MADKMTRQETLDWKKGFEAAREAERLLTRREPVNVERSIRLALALIEICRRQGIWPDAGSRSVRERSEIAVRERWGKLKMALRP
jgi:hypothetical protein